MQLEKEHHLNSLRMGGWVLDTSLGHQFLNKFLGSGYALTDALCLAKLLSCYLDIPLDRAAQRRKSVLVKWFDENIRVIEPFCNNHVKPLFNEVVAPPTLGKK